MPQIEGQGTAGVPRPEVVSVQGVTNGTPIPVSGAGGVSAADESSFTPGTTPGSLSQYIVDDTSTDTVAEGNLGAARMSPLREQRTNPSADTAIEDTAVTVTGSATALPTTALANRKSMIIANAGTAAVYVGGASVTIAIGIPLEPGEKMGLDVGPEVTVYAIRDSVNQDVRVLEFA